MKKIFLSLLVMAATVNVMATVTAKAKLTLSNGTTSNSVTIAIDDAATANSSMVLYEGGMGAATLIPYIYDGGTKYSIYAVTDMQDVKLGYKVPSVGDYTLSVSNVQGTLTFAAPDGSVVTLADGQSWTVSATATEVTEAFTINPSVPTTPAICHEDGMLKVTGDITAPVQLDGADILTAAGNYDLSTTAPGQHKVTFEGQELIINVR